MPLAPAAGPGTATREEPRGALRESAHIYLLPGQQCPRAKPKAPQSQDGEPTGGGTDCKKPRQDFALSFLSGPQFSLLQK